MVEGRESGGRHDGGAAGFRALGKTFLYKSSTASEEACVGKEVAATCCLLGRKMGASTSNTPRRKTQWRTAIPLSVWRLFYCPVASSRIPHYARMNRSECPPLRSQVLNLL